MLATLVFLAANGAAVAAAAPIDFPAALDLSHRDEKSLPPAAMKSLLEAQGNALGASFAACKPNALPTDFTVVLELDATGTPAQHWRKGDSTLARCAERELAQRLHWTPPSAPFYTSFEMTFKP